MLQREHSAILSTFFKLPFVIKIFVLSIFEWPLKTGFTVSWFIFTGRTHRSNQVSAPEYLFLISELAGEQRFASTVSKRLESLVSHLNSCSAVDPDQQEEVS